MNQLNMPNFPRKKLGYLEAATAAAIVISLSACGGGGDTAEPVAKIAVAASSIESLDIKKSTAATGAIEEIAQQTPINLNGVEITSMGADQQQISSGVMLLPFDNEDALLPGTSGSPSIEPLETSETRAKIASAVPTFNQDTNYSGSPQLGRVIHAGTVGKTALDSGKYIFLTPQYFSETKKSWVDAKYWHDMPKRTSVRLRFVDHTLQFAPTKSILMYGAAQGSFNLSLCTKDGKLSNKRVEVRVSTVNTQIAPYTHETWIFSIINDAPASFKATGCTGDDPVAPVANTPSDPVAPNAIRVGSLSFTPSFEIAVKNTKKPKEPLFTHTFGSNSPAQNVAIGGSHILKLEKLRFALLTGVSASPTWITMPAGSQLKLESAVETDLVGKITPQLDPNKLVAVSGGVAVNGYGQISLANPSDKAKKTITMRFPLVGQANINITTPASFNLDGNARAELRFSYVLDDPKKKITFIANVDIAKIAPEMLQKPDSFFSAMLMNPADSTSGQIRVQFSVDDALKNKAYDVADQIKNTKSWGEPLAVLLKGIGDLFPQAWGRFTVGLASSSTTSTSTQTSLDISSIGSSFNGYANALTPGDNIIGAVKDLHTLTDMKGLATLSSFVTKIPTFSGFNPGELFKQYSSSRKEKIISLVLKRTSEIMVQKSAESLNGTNRTSFNNLILPLIGETQPQYTTRLVSLFKTAFNVAILDVFKSKEMWEDILKDQLSQELRSHTLSVVAFTAQGASVQAAAAVLGAVSVANSIGTKPAVPGYKPTPPSGSGMTFKPSNPIGICRSCPGSQNLYNDAI